MGTRLLKGTEVARILGISKGLAYRLMAQGDIPSIHFSAKTVRVKEEALLQFIETHSNDSQVISSDLNGGSHE
jgi:excisionase family DNA binding protein